MYHLSPAVQTEGWEVGQAYATVNASDLGSAEEKLLEKARKGAVGKKTGETASGLAEDLLSTRLREGLRARLGFIHG